MRSPLKISHRDKVSLKMQGLCPTTSYFYNSPCAYTPAQLMSISWFLQPGNALGMRAPLEICSAEHSLDAPLTCSSSLRDPEANLAFRDLPASLRFASRTVGKLPCGAVGCKMLRAMRGRHRVLLGTSTNRGFVLLLNRLFGWRHYLYLCNDLKMYPRETK